MDGPNKKTAAIDQDAYFLQRIFFPVHVYIHYTDMHGYPERMQQIRHWLVNNEFLPFPVTVTPVMASSESDTNIFDVYVVGGHRRYKLGIWDRALPTLVEIIDTIGWAAVRDPTVVAPPGDSIVEADPDGLNNSATAGGVVAAAAAVVAAESATVASDDGVKNSGQNATASLMSVMSMTNNEPEN